MVQSSGKEIWTYLTGKVELDSFYANILGSSHHGTVEAGMVGNARGLCGQGCVEDASEGVGNVICRSTQNFWMIIERSMKRRFLRRY